MIVWSGAGVTLCIQIYIIRYALFHVSELLGNYFTVISNNSKSVNTITTYNVRTVCYDSNSYKSVHCYLEVNALQNMSAKRFQFLVAVVINLR